MQLGGHPVSVRPDEVGLDEPRDGRGRGPHPAPATTPPSAPGCSSTPTLERMAAVGRGARRQPALRRRPPAPGPRRPAHHPRRVRPARRPHGRLGRRLQQRGPLAGAGRGHARHGASGSPARPATARRRRPRPASAALGGDVDGHRPTRRGGRRAPTSSPPTCGPRWARRPRPTARRPAFAGFTVDAALMAAAARRRHLPALPARPPGRGGHRRGARRSAQPGVARRPPTACTPPAARSPGCWRVRP